MPCWELDEAVALSFGKCPKMVNLKKLINEAHNSTFVASYKQLRDFVERAREPVYGWTKLDDGPGWVGKRPPRGLIP